MFSKSALILLSFQICACFGDELVSTVMIFRHGARAPRVFHPTDPYKNRSHWPVPPGELTEEGKQMAYELGKWARTRYHDFLPEAYASRDFFLYSSGIDRTLMSAALVAQGLYPPIKSNNPPYQVVPIHSKPPQIDNTILSDQPCPAREYLLEKNMKSEFFKRIDEENQDVYQYLSTHTGTSIKNFKGLHALYDTLFIEERHNFTLPEWTKKVYPEKLQELAIYNLIVRTFDTESTRFRIGSLFSEILSHFKSFTSCKNEFESDFQVMNRGRKMLAVSGHDINIADVLRVLKFPLDFWPSYSSSVIFELRKKNDSELFVSAFFKNSTGVRQLDTMQCGLECRFNDFVNLVKPILMDPKEWRHECILDEKLSYHIEDEPESSRYI